MALTGILGTASSELGNFVPGYGASVSSGKSKAAADTATAADAASAVRVMPTGISVAASDLATFSGQASVAAASQTVIGWISPEQSTAFHPAGGFYETPNAILGVAVYSSTVSFDLVVSGEYAGSDLKLTVFWTSNLAASWSGTIKAQVYKGAWQASNNCWSGTAPFAFPSGAWSLQATSIALLAASAPFPIVPGQVYTVAFTINPTATPGGFGSFAVPFLLLEAAVQNK